MTQLRETLATNIKRHRLSKGWSQEMLALESGLHRTFIGHVELARRNIAIDNIERIANALGVSPAALLIVQPITGESDVEFPEIWPK